MHFPPLWKFPSFTVVPRVRFVLFAAAILLGPTGCALFGGMRVPAAERAPQAVQRRLDPASQKAALAELFPPLDLLYVKSATLSLDHSRVLGETRLHLILFAQADAQWRMMLSKGSEQLLDAIDRNGYLTAILYRTGDLCQGPTPPEGTPFRAAFGWDGADLFRALAIGQSIAAAGLKQDRNAAGAVIWRPETQTGPTSTTLALDWVRLDPKSGLPSQAHWNLGNSGGMTADYRAWDSFVSADRTSDSSAPTTQTLSRLLPARVVLAEEPSGAKIDLAVAAYSLAPSIDPSHIYSPVINYQPRQKPFSELIGALK